MKTYVAAALACVLASPAFAQAQSAPTDPAHMSRSALRAEVEASRPLIENGGVTPQRPPGCTTPETRQFDFWIGEWDVTPSGQSMVVGEATVTPTSQGCALIEDFRPFQGAHGSGLFGYDPSVGKWRQTYIDATGAYGTAQGELANGVMSFSIVSPPPPSRFPPDMQRHINFQRVDADTVRQWGERMDPAAHAWVTFFDLTYHRRGAH